MKNSINNGGIPKINFQGGVLKIKGRSTCIHASDEYKNILDDFRNYCLTPEENTEIHLDLEYTNSASNRSLLNLLILAEKLYFKGKQVKIFWYTRHGDDLMFEQARLFTELLTLPISIVRG